MDRNSFTKNNRMSKKRVFEFISLHASEPVKHAPQFLPQFLTHTAYFKE